MNQYRVSDAARSDLDEIWYYIAQANMDAADRFLGAIVSHFPKLAAMPQIGRARKELSPRLRSFPVGRYIIFYRPMENGVEIARVLHGARDIPPLFE
ncbi:MAG: type II toxin-antitoxin system RelE/ParE family toxin [Limisphaerales bacterium]